MSWAVALRLVSVSTQNAPEKNIADEGPGEVGRQTDPDPRDAEEGDGRHRGPSPQPSDEPLADKGPKQGPGTHRRQQCAKGAGSATQCLGSPRQDRLHHGRGDGEQGHQQKETPEHRRVAGVADSEADRGPERGGLPDRAVDRAPDHDQGNDHRGVAEGIDREAGLGAEGGDDQPTDGGPDGPGHVESRRVERHRVGNHQPWHEVGKQRVPGGEVEGDPGAQDQPEAEQPARCDQVGGGEDRHRQRRAAHDHL